MNYQKRSVVFTAVSTVSETLATSDLGEKLKSYQYRLNLEINKF